MGVSIFEGHPDDLWGGHDWEHWWSCLRPAQREQLLDLAWGDEPVPLVGERLTRLRGATYPQVEETRYNGRHGTFTRHLATDDFLVFLQEKRNEPDRLR
ncbi:hypothetical protein [Kineococcus aurantiacus]|uniref:Uncharacterized protein n=1 Tax=Kineococcus aurantiacus TaxID=37633 RepID=A0A7Y9J1E2_9ACTN|nr:hypothetical protein [Kineococcus aurantiacus]NYD22974.1 hypothetical protein [Kineococcus aurantiacus]